MIKYFEISIHLYSFHSGALRVKNFKDLNFIFIIPNQIYVSLEMHVYSGY